MRFSTYSFFVVLSSVSVFANACVTQSQGEVMGREIKEMKTRLDQLSQRDEEGQKKLKSLIEQATGVVQRNSANVGVQVEQLQARVATLTGQMEEINKLVTDMKTQLLDAQMRAGGGPIPEDRDELYRTATTKYTANDHTEARRLFRAYIAKFVNDARAPQAQLMLGHGYYAEQKFAPAVQEYRKVLDLYKTSPVVADALYYIGMSFYQLKYCTDALAFFTELSNKYREHAQLPNAQKLMDVLRKNKRNKNFCQN